GHLLRRRVEVAGLAGRGPALRRRPWRRTELGERSAGGGPDDRWRGRGPPVRRDDGQRRRLGREADRRLPRAPPGELGPGRLPAYGVKRGVPGPLPQELREAGADPARR